MGSSPIDRTILSRLWRNWQTRYFEGVVNESSYGFKSHQPHHLAFSSGIGLGFFDAHFALDKMGGALYTTK